MDFIHLGLFCHLTWCEVNVCGENGICNLTSNGWTCDCLPGFSGPRCQQTVTPCLPNPCEPNGVCTPKNGTFACICAQDYEGNSSIHVFSVKMHVETEQTQVLKLQFSFFYSFII